ncbi:MAG: hypothetical protein GY838_01990 [bacterium]|nr:hypothetical protein [bacterium]
MRLATCALLALAVSVSHAAPGTVEFVESWPEHTAYDMPELRDAAEVWAQVLGDAGSHIDLAGFYFSRKGDGDDAYGPESAPDLLVPALDAVAAAAERGVVVRCLADAKFAVNYAEVPAWLGGLPGAETRIFDVAPHWGGVLHAKYFLVDDTRFHIGSQNFDWRALGQIRELGVLVDHAGLAADLRRVYDLDWNLAGGGSLAPADPMETALADLPTHTVRTAAGDEVSALVTASPRHGLPAGIPWDLPLLVEMIDAARDSVHLQLLSYGVTDREKRVFDDLDRALRRAAVRGAQVRILLSNWAKSRYALPWVKGLALLPNIEVRFTNIPDHPDGFIPFARVEHAKYLTVDGDACWIGTSNWSRDYFYSSRNVGLVLLGTGAAHDPDRFFNRGWHGPYTESVEPGAEYAPPRRR